MQGLVTSAGKMAHTATVTVERKVTDHKTLKVRQGERHAAERCIFGSRVLKSEPYFVVPQVFKQHKKFLVHDPDQVCVVGDQVTIRNCKPVSKRKRFELLEVTKGARERTESRGESIEQLQQTT